MSDSIIPTEHGRYYFFYINENELTANEIIGYKYTDNDDKLRPITLPPETLIAEIQNDSLTESDDYLRYDAALNEMDGFALMDVLSSFNSSLQSQILEKSYLLNANYHRLDHQIRDLPDSFQRKNDEN